MQNPIFSLEPGEMKLLDENMETIYVDEAVLVEAYEQRRPDLKAFLNFATRIVGFNKIRFMMTLLSKRLINDSDIPASDRDDVESGVFEEIEPQQDQRQYENFVSLKERYVNLATLIYDTPTLDKKFFDEMEIFDDVVLILFRKGRDNLVKQSRHISPEQYRIVTTKKLFDRERSEDGILIYLMKDNEPIMINVTSWFVKVTADVDYDLDHIVERLSQWGIETYGWFVFSAKYSAVFRDIPYEPIMFNLALSGTDDARYLSPNEEKNLFWEKSTGISSPKNYIFSLPGDPYSSQLGTVSLKPSIYLSQKDLDVPIGTRLLTLTFNKGSGRDREHAAFVFRFVASIVKRTRMEEAFQLISRLAKTTGLFRDFDKYLVNYQKTLYMPDKNPVRTMVSHMDRYIPDDKWRQGFFRYCSMRWRPLYADREDEEAWIDAGYTVQRERDHIIVALPGEHLNEFYIDVEGEEKLFWKRSTSKTDPEIRYVSGLENIPGDFNNKEKMMRKTKTYFLLINFVSSNRLALQYPDLAGKDTLLECLAIALGKSKIEIIEEIEDSFFDVNLTGFVDHRRYLEQLEEIFLVNLMIITDDELFTTSVKKGRPIFIFKLVYNKLKQPFYSIVKETTAESFFNSEKGLQVLSEQMASKSEASFNGYKLVEPARSRVRSSGQYRPAILGKEVHGQVLDILGRRVITSLSEDHTVLVFHAPSVPMNVQLIDELTPGPRIGERADHRSPNVLWKGGIGLIGKTDGQADMPNPDFLVDFPESERTLQDELAEIEIDEKYQRFYLNMLAQALVFQAEFETGDIDILSADMERYRLVESLEELEDLWHEVYGQPPTIRADLEEEIWNFFDFIDHNVDFVSGKDVQISRNGDALFYEKDFKQTEDVVTFSSIGRYWSWFDNLQVEENKVIMYIPLLFADREESYVATVDNENHIIYNVNDKAEAVFVTDYFHRNGELPERNKIVSKSIGDINFQMFYLAPRTSQLLRDKETETKGAYPYNLLKYPASAGKYKYGVLLEY